MDKVEIFYSYSHKDEDLRKGLEAQLSFLRWKGLTIEWHDRRIAAGAEWAHEVDKHLNTADIILLLVSRDFMQSDYCYSKEMMQAMKRHKAGETYVIPIILRPFHWQDAPFGKLSALPTDGKPVTSRNWHDLDEAFFDVAEGIRKVVDELTKKTLDNRPRPDFEIPLPESKNITDSKGVSDKDISNSNSLPDESGMETSWIRSELPYTISGSQILTPSLVIMLGTTSAITGLELMRHMLTLNLRDRQRVALVYIDIGEPPSELVKFRLKHKGIFQEFPLSIAVPTGITEVPRIVQNETERTKPELEREQHTFIEGKIPQYFVGAGGIRNNGHVAACFHYQYIYNTLEHALSIISGGSTADQGEVRRLGVQVNIVSFLGGGTGSGILPDIAAMTRELLAKQMFKQHINLFCMLPEPIRGASLRDINWRKSNATACLLELIALSRAAEPTTEYRKFMRSKLNLLTNDPIANEVYLIGQSRMDDEGDTARLVGFDLFQRITDASGVGLLEYSKWIDRHVLRNVDDRGLPSMFGLLCPLEVCFPAESMATAFAQISAAHLLLLLANYQPAPPDFTYLERLEKLTEWRDVGQFSTGSSILIKAPEFFLGDFKNADQARLDILWGKLRKYEFLVEEEMKSVISIKFREEIIHMGETSLHERHNMGLLYKRILYLKRLEQEYQLALDDLKAEEMSKILERPLELEIILTNQSLPPLKRDTAANTICDIYNERVWNQVKVIRYRLLEQLINVLKLYVREALSDWSHWFQAVEVDEHAKELEMIGRTSRAWQGQFEYPHLHQRHIFDLRTLRTQNNRNIATEQLYRWATVGVNSTDKDAVIDYSGFVAKFTNYLYHNNTPSLSKVGKDLNDFERSSIANLTEFIVAFFRDYYIERFQNMNLFDLLDKAAPASPKGQTRFSQISNYLLEHLEYIRLRMASLVAFEALLSPEGLAKLDTSIYLGMHWRDGAQRTLLQRTMETLGPVTERSQSPTVELSVDPHRLQISYGQHGISLSTVREFYLEQNSAMEAYLQHQREWETSQGTGNVMPVHSSGEAQRLVLSAGVLGNSEWAKLPLPRRIIRQSNLQSSSSAGMPSGMSNPQRVNPVYANNPKSTPPVYPNNPKGTLPPDAINPQRTPPLKANNPNAPELAKSNEQQQKESAPVVPDWMLRDDVPPKRPQQKGPAPEIPDWMLKDELPPKPPNQ